MEDHFIERTRNHIKEPDQDQATDRDFKRSSQINRCIRFKGRALQRLPVPVDWPQLGTGGPRVSTIPGDQCKSGMG
jgi:hypothetical protein